jgi:hypothetical protein
MTDLLHRGIAWLVVAPIAGAAFGATSFWTLQHNPLQAANEASSLASPEQLARSQARVAKLSVILQANQTELRLVNAETRVYQGRASATRGWASSNSNIVTAAKAAAPTTQARTGASGARK